MWMRSEHAETSIPALRDFIRANPLGVITTSIPSENYPLIQATHLPWLIDVDDESSESELGRLRGHMAKMNPQSKAIVEALNSRSPRGGANSTLDQEVLIMFTHPIQSYVTSKFYVESGPATGKVAPTWNYAAVQVYGKAKFYIDPAADETINFMMKNLDDLSGYMEREMMGYTGEDGRPEPWKLSGAPEKWVEALRQKIIGVEVEITRMEGKYKMSQELKDGDRVGVIEGFRKLGTEKGRDMADLVQERQEKRRRHT